MKIAVVQDPEINNSRSNDAQGINEYHHQVTRSISYALINLGHDVETCEANSSFVSLLKQIKPDFAFNTSIKKINASLYAYAPEILEKLCIPYSGPSASACSNAYDKQKTIEILRKAEVYAPNAVTFSPGDEIRIPHNMHFPLFVKPQKGGCSQGITRNNLILNMDKAQEKINALLEEIGNPLIIEEFLPGREFTVGILGNQPPQVLPILEFTFKDSGLPFRSYSRKMINYEVEEEVCLASLNAVEQLAIENLAIRSFKALACRDYARVDIRMDAVGVPAILEVNAIPNLQAETSSFGLMAKYAEISFDELIDQIINFSLERYSAIKKRYS